MQIQSTSVRFKQIFFKYIPYIIIFLIAFLLYAKTISFDITDNDDAQFIYANADSYKSQTLIKDIFTNNVLFGGYSAYYRPVLTLTFALEHIIAGTNPQFAHLTNILLHLCSCFLCFFFFKKYLMSPTAALIAAVIFTLHPANIYTVAWIPGRNDSLFFIFFLPSLMFFAKYIDKHNLIFLFLHTLFFLLLLFTKESAVILPFIMIFFFFTHKKAEDKFFPDCIYAILLQTAALILFLILKNNALDGGNFIIPAISNSINISNISMFFEYYKSMFFLSTPLATDTSIVGIFLGFAAIIFTLISVLSFKEKRPQMLFYFLLPFMFLIPTMLTTRIWFQGNRIYLPLFAVLAVCFSYFDAFFAYRKKYIKFALCAILIFMLSCSYITSIKLNYFKNGLSFWSGVYNDFKQPPTVIANHYASELLRFGYPDEALPIIENVLMSSKKTDLPATFNLANYYLIKNDIPKAAHYFETVLDNPVLADAETYAYLYLCARFLNNSRALDFYYGQTVKKSDNSSEKADKFISEIYDKLTVTQKKYKERKG